MAADSSVAGGHCNILYGYLFRAPYGIDPAAHYSPVLRQHAVSPVQYHPCLCPQDSPFQRLWFPEPDQLLLLARDFSRTIALGVQVEHPGPVAYTDRRQHGRVPPVIRALTRAQRPRCRNGYAGSDVCADIDCKFYKHSSAAQKNKTSPLITLMNADSRGYSFGVVIRMREEQQSRADDRQSC